MFISKIIIYASFFCTHVLMILYTWCIQCFLRFVISTLSKLNQSRAATVSYYKIGSILCTFSSWCAWMRICKHWYDAWQIYNNYTSLTGLVCPGLIHQGRWQLHEKGRKIMPTLYTACRCVNAAQIYTVVQYESLQYFGGSILCKEGQAISCSSSGRITLFSTVYFKPPALSPW